ncbi:MAG: phosphatidylserine decarboxylase, partial [Actinomycetota bacterium]|nr:phosphatidylserine decarboxylase [Actinomycetota bacterium]
MARPYLLAPSLPGVALLVARRRSGLLFLGAAAAVLLFFRDPHRPLDPDPDTVYSAADGLVTGVTKLRDPWIPGGDAVRISTFLGLHNVHVTRSPVGGKVTDIE